MAYKSRRHSRGESGRSQRGHSVGIEELAAGEALRLGHVVDREISNSARRHGRPRDSAGRGFTHYDRSIVGVEPPSQPPSGETLTRILSRSPTLERQRARTGPSPVSTTEAAHRDTGVLREHRGRHRQADRRAGEQLSRRTGASTRGRVRCVQRAARRPPSAGTWTTAVRVPEPETSGVVFSAPVEDLVTPRDLRFDTPAARRAALPCLFHEDLWIGYRLD